MLLGVFTEDGVEVTSIASKAESDAADELLFREFSEGTVGDLIDTFHGSA